MREHQNDWTAGAFAFVRNLAAFFTAAGVIWIAGSRLAGPSINSWAHALLEPVTIAVQENSARIDQIEANRDTILGSVDESRQSLVEITDIQRNVSDVLTNVTGRLRDLELNERRDTGSVIRFMPRGNEISDGSPGSTVEVTWTFLKLRGDCGQPAVSVFFRDSRGRTFRFTDVSALSADGRGVGVSHDRDIPQVLSYTAQIPDNHSISIGRAFGWSRVQYVDCPGVETAQAPETPFMIRANPGASERSP